MIKVIDIDGQCGWKKHYLDPDKEPKSWNDNAWYESPVLEKFLKPKIGDQIKNTIALSERANLLNSKP